MSLLYSFIHAQVCVPEFCNDSEIRQLPRCMIEHNEITRDGEMWALYTICVCAHQFTCHRYVLILKEARCSIATFTHLLSTRKLKELQLWKFITTFIYIKFYRIKCMISKNKKKSINKKKRNQTKKSNFIKPNIKFNNFSKYTNSFFIPFLWTLITVLTIISYVYLDNEHKRKS